VYKRQLMTLCSGPRQGAPAGSGPMREVATELLKLLITPEIFSITPSGRYQSILPQDALGLSRSREARLTAAGFACLFHIVWTGAGPLPISPFLLFSLITESHDQLLHPSFLRHLDDDGDAHRYDDYFNAIGAVRDRLASGELPLLAPFQDHIMNYHQLMVSPEIISFTFEKVTDDTLNEQVSQVESPEYHQDTESLHSLLLSYLFDVAGVKGVYPHLHRDVKAFKNGFTLMSLPSRITERPEYARVGYSLNLTCRGTNFAKVWPEQQHLKKFIAQLYNCQPKSGKDVTLRFIPTNNPDLRSLEALWESRFRSYLDEVGVPFLADWVDHPEGLDMSKPSGRAIMLLKASTGASLMPINSSECITVSAPLIRLSSTVC
jgi:hypothetical protein